MVMMNIDDETYILNDNERLDELGIDNLKVIQNTKYFCFGIDSVLLANFVKSDSSKNVILDLCSGTGVIPILLSSKVKYSNIHALELQDEMYDLLKRNISMNKLEDSIKYFKEDVKNIKGIRKHLLDTSHTDTADVITVNPPYKKQGSGIENENTVKNIARNEILCNLEDIFLTASSLLNDGGKLYLVHKPDRLADLIVFARKYKLEAKQIRFVHPKVNSKPCIVLIQYIKCAKSELNILEPLYEFDENGNYTEEIYRLYGWKGNNTNE